MEGDSLEKRNIPSAVADSIPSKLDLEERGLGNLIPPSFASLDKAFTHELPGMEVRVEPREVEEEYSVGGDCGPNRVQGPGGSCLFILPKKRYAEFEA